MVLNLGKGAKVCTRARKNRKFGTIVGTVEGKQRTWLVKFAGEQEPVELSSGQLVRDKSFDDIDESVPSTSTADTQIGDENESDEDNNDDDGNDNDGNDNDHHQSEPEENQDDEEASFGVDFDGDLSDDGSESDDEDLSGAVPSPICNAKSATTDDADDIDDIVEHPPRPVGEDEEDDNPIQSSADYEDEKSEEHERKVSAYKRKKDELIEKKERFTIAPTRSAKYDVGDLVRIVSYSTWTLRMLMTLSNNLSLVRCSGIHKEKRCSG